MKRKLFMLLLSTTLISNLFIETAQSAGTVVSVDITTSTTPNDATKDTPVDITSKDTTPDIPVVSGTPEDSEENKDISKAKVSEISPVTYNGKEQKPAITLTIDGENVSKENYTLTYKNNINAGTAQILITGTGEFTGTQQVTFTIQQKNIATLTCSKISDKSYSGKAIKPSVVLKDGNTTLKKEKDYVVTYKNNKKVGNGEITLKGKGNYNGTKVVTFKILPKKVSSFKTATATSTSIKLKWKKSSSITGYEIFQYDKKTKKYKLKKRVSAKNTSYTVKKLSPYTEYRFKIRAYTKVGSKKYYGAYSKVVKVKTLVAAPKMTVVSRRKGQTVIQYKKVKNATGLELSYRQGNGAYVVVEQPFENRNDSIFMRGMTEGAVYTFRMRAYQESGGKKVYGDYSTQKVTISSQGSVLNGGNYNPGSVYGPKLTQTELNQVREKVQYFKDYYIDDSMSDYLKVKLAHDYLASVCSYAPDWSQNRANTAWGALVYGEAQCSGYARAMKALCDGIGVECYYVHANSNSANPSHQWNEVKVDGNWYIVDVQCNDSSGFYAFFLVSDSTYSGMTGMDWDRQSVPPCPKDY